MDNLDFARLQMAVSLGFHIVFAVIGIGMPVLTFAATKTAHATLVMLTWALGIGAVVLFPSFAYLFYVFKRHDEPHEGHTRDHP